MSSYPKRMSKTIQRARKKTQPQMQSVKSSTQQGLLNTGDVGLYSNPHLTYYLARCVIGNVGEIYTNSSKSVGVIKAVSQNGNFGLKYVRTVSNKAENGPFELEEDKLFPLADIKKIILRNVKPSECQKDGNISTEANEDSEICLQTYFSNNEDKETFTFNSGENFTPEEMFEVNEKLYNVTSSYRSSLEGYTLPLDKSDPQFKIKEMYYAKVAVEIEDGATLDNTIDEDLENNEELQFSAVLQDGVPGRDLKHFNRGRRAARGNRASLPRDTADVHRAGDGSARPIRNAGSHERIINSNEKNYEIKLSAKSFADSLSEKVPLNDGKTSDERCANNIDAPSINVSQSDVRDAQKVTSESVATSTKKEETKKFTLDPDAPEFKPSGLFPPIDQAPLQQQPPPVAPFPFVPMGFSQSIPCQTMQAFQVPAQPHMLNGNVNTQSIPFCMPSSVSYVVPSNMAPALRQQQAISYNPQQLTMISQQLPVSGQQPVVSTSVSKNGARSNLPPGGFMRQRSADQQNHAAQQMSYSMFHAQPGNQFFSSGHHPAIQFITNANGSVHPSSYAGMTTMANTVAVSQASGQQMINASHLTPPQSIQMQLAQSNSQPLTSIPQGQNPASQFHPCFQPQLASVQQQAAYAAQYPGGHLMSSQASGMPGTLGFYPSVYQSSGLIPIQIPQGQVGANGQPIQHQPNPQMHHPNQQSLGLSQANIQLQQQQQAQQQIILQNQPYQLQSNLINTQFLQQQVPIQTMLAMAMAGNQQAMQNSQNIPTSHHSMPVFMNQQPNGTGG